MFNDNHCVSSEISDDVKSVGQVVMRGLTVITGGDTVHVPVNVDVSLTCPQDLVDVTTCVSYLCLSSVPCGHYIC